MIAQFDRFTIEMTKLQAISANHSGSCDNDVDYFLTLAKIKQQLKDIPDKLLADELREYGAWSEKQLKNRGENEARIIWLAAGNIAENKN